MRLKCCLFLFASVFYCVPSALAQDISQLPTRAQKLWELRQQTNKLGALQFIDAATQKNYLQWQEPPILNFKVTGLEFTDDRNRVDVVLRVRSVLPQLGEMDLIVREPWVWKDKKWSMLATASAAGLFNANTNTKAGEDLAPPKFVVENPVVELGAHVQGDFLQGRLAFRANRNEIRIVNPRGSVPGLDVGLPVWTADSEGYIPYSWSTALLSRNMDSVIKIEATGINDGKTTIDLRFRVNIQPKVAFKQVPEVVDVTKPGKVELQIENLTLKPIELQAVLSYNSSFTIIDEGLPATIEPGKTLPLVIRYIAQNPPVGGSIAVGLSERIGPSPMLTIPLNVNLPKPDASTSSAPSREELERIIRATPKANIP